MENEWILKKREENINKNHGVCEENKLELRLGPPDGDWSIKDSSNTRGRENDFGKFSSCAKRGLLDPVNGGGKPHQFSCFLHLQSSQPGSSKGAVDLNMNSAEKKAFSQPAPLPNTSQKRTAPSPVVGWPPLGSYRKNLATSTSVKPIPESMENSQKGLFVKINMDGIPIGRKVDLNAYDTYEKLASAVNQLFKGLLAAQNEGSHGEEGGEKAITGLLDGSGEYTLVYEDNEGDTMLVGDDVHWQMFVSTVKRLRVLKTSELSTLSRGKQVKL